MTVRNTRMLSVNGSAEKRLLPVGNGLATAMRRALQCVVTCDNIAAEILDDKNNSTGFLDQRRKEGL